MSKMLAYPLIAIAFVSGTLAMRTARAQQTTPYPGEMTRATVWVTNRGAEQAVPTAIENIRPGVVVPVEVARLPAISLDPGTGVRARAARGAWEYRVVTIASGQDVAAALNGPGADGWETTGMAFPSPAGTAILLKRPN
jgi:hypothetical protein